MSTINKPYTFSPNTSISSSQVNANFDTLYNDYNGGISAANLATDAVTTAKIADANVTTAKLADESVTPEKRSGGFYATLHAFGSGTGSKSITDVPFAPRAMIVLGNGRNSATELSTSTGYAYDTGSGIVQGAQSAYRDDAGGSDASSNTTGAFLARGDGSNFFVGAVTSFNSDGVTVNVTTQSGSTAYASYHVVFYA